MSWPAADGYGATVTDYTLTILRDGAKEDEIGFSGDTLSSTVDVAQNGANYTFTVRARNAVGESGESPASAPIVPFGPPFAVGAVTATPDRPVRRARLHRAGRERTGHHAASRRR